MALMKEKREEPQKEGNHLMQRLESNPLLVEAIVAFVIIALVGGLLYYQQLDSRISIEKSEISAPIISLAPQTTGILEGTRVKEGDSVGKGKVVAVVGNQTLRTQMQGLIVWVQDTPGQIVTSQTPVVKMVDPREFRVIGHIDEDKGLSAIKPGQKAVFTVDAFGSKEYQGVVEMVVPSARQSDIVFSISDKREVRQFDVKVLYDVNAYPELKNGMSAKLWIYK
jgi:multidrug resistance efflux pump